MTKILIVKTSSMGDVIHTLPALTDAVKALRTAEFDWVVEEGFAEIPKWSSHVRKVIPVAWRRLRKQPLALLNSGALTPILKELRQERYDYVIDAQGLIKSAVITRLSRGLRCGLDRYSAREPIASFAYQKKIFVDPMQHAIKRVRQLFSQALDYEFEESIDYGLSLSKLGGIVPTQNYLVFIHGTTWESKEWPEAYWIELAKLVGQQGYEVLMPWGNAKEKTRAERIGKDFTHVKVLPACTLTDLASLLASAKGIVSVDTGLGHLSAALSVPTVSLYGPTDPNKIGTMGQNQKHLSVNFKCAPCESQRCNYSEVSEIFPACFISIPPLLVWNHLLKMMERTAVSGKNFGD